jgi:hypothetical protein
MRTPRAPRLDRRRSPQFTAELYERARAWVPSWGLADGERDFGRALLQIAARFSSEVAERLDDAGEKMRRGFLDWLAVRGEAARPARMPVVFKLADTARDAVLASAPVRLQVDAGGTPVVFETETDVRLVPGRLELVVGADADADAFYLPAPGLTSLEPLEPLPTQWQLKSFAAADARKLQLDPELGLVAEMIVEALGQQFRILQADKDIVTIEPPLTQGLPAQTIVRKVTGFAPFDGKARNRQEHALYLGHMELLNIEAGATLEVVGAKDLGESVDWEYWGKVDGKDEVTWQKLARAEGNKQQPDAVVLEKPKGAVEPREIGAGLSSRWIRAVRSTVDSAASPFRVEALSIRVNCNRHPVPCPPIEEADSPAAEAMANTTPLVLAGVFFPLGKEPRQFDAFYLGSAEAFSKKGAKVQLCFEMADLSFEALACLRTGPLAHQVLAGVARDGYLHLLGIDPATGRLSRYNNREPLRPPSPGPYGAVVAGLPVTLDPHPDFRAAIWAIDYLITQEIFVAVTAGGAVWAWREVGLIPPLSGWEAFGTVGPVSNSTKQIDGLVYLADGLAGKLIALRESKLFIRDLNDSNPAWRLVETKSGGTTLAMEKIVPIGVEGSTLASGSFTEGLVGVGANQALYAVTFGGVPLEGTCVKLLDDVASDVAPAAVRRLDGRLVAVAVGKNPLNRKLLGFLSTPSTFAEEDLAEAPLAAIGVVGRSIDVNRSAGHLTFLMCLQVDALTALARWSPFDPAVPAALFTTTIPADVGPAAGAPTLLPSHVVVPVLSSQVLVAGFDPSSRLTLHEPLRTAVITDTAADRLQVGDWLAIPFDASGSTKYQLQPVASPGIQRGGETLHEFNIESIDDALFVYRTSALQFSATVGPALDALTLDAGDTETNIDTILLITTDASTDLYKVIAFDAGTMVVELDRPIEVVDPTAPPATVMYQVPELTGARLVPLLRLNPATTGNWDAALLGRTYLVFPGADPLKQRGTAFQVDANRRPILVALAQHWTTAPPDTGSGAQFVVDGAVANWTGQLGDTSSNPDLSWEYWNGTGWWKLDAVNDETLNLKRSGAVKFAVPADLRTTDWSGRTNHWIRARLIGGDYGREKVTVKTSPPDAEGVTQQTVERSSKDIRAPSVVKLHISYQLCEGVLPTFVLAKDSGSTRDQSDANRTAGAIVEAFVPLAVTLGRLSGAVATPAGAEECPPECSCPGASPGIAGGPVAAATLAAGTSPPASGRALFLGLKAVLSGAPVNVLLLVEEERVHDQFAPMTVEALVTNRFVPIVVSDTTRALGESNVLSMAFALEPTPRDLFGETLTWLRLTPAARGPADEWKPTLRGAYLNAVWASAAETLTRELVGSSDGAPSLTLYLARPPLLSDKLDPRDTLELRVREPLGEEERDALRNEDDKLVLSAVENLPGDWVLWKRVIDPGDEPATARVYALDETNGEIRFGDGQHGAIPPVGRDSIVAFKYRRTEAGTAGSASVPANAIGARTTLNLVSPVESVEAVFAADQAAGGAPPEVAERVLRFGTARLRHRNRAVTADDFEDLVLQSSPDIVQARCFLRRGFVRLVVLMRGKNPLPNAAQVRELRRLLLAASPTSLSVPQALRIGGPSIRRLRIDLRLRVANLDHAGGVARSANERITAFFDTAAGGAEQDGWALGEDPSEAYIALALTDLSRLEGIAGVALREITPDDAERPWAGAIKPTELVMLADDAIRVEFETVEVMV